MSKAELGAFRRMVQAWPIVVGTCLGLIVILGTVVLIYESGLWAKMRPHKLDEADVQLERRKTLIRKSMKRGQSPPIMGTSL